MGLGALAFLSALVIAAIVDPARPSGVPATTTATTPAASRMVARSTDTPLSAPTATLTPQQWASGAPGDTYTQVNDHPDLYQGDKVVWPCTIAKFLGDDPNVIGNTDVGCMVHLGDYNDQEIILSVPPTIDTSAMDSSDDLTVYGTVDQPMQGKTTLGVDSSWTQIDAVYLVDARLTPAEPAATATPIATALYVEICDTNETCQPGNRTLTQSAAAGDDLHVGGGVGLVITGVVHFSVAHLGRHGSATNVTPGGINQPTGENVGQDGSPAAFSLAALLPSMTVVPKSQWPGVTTQAPVPGTYRLSITVDGHAIAPLIVTVIR